MTTLKVKACPFCNSPAAPFEVYEGEWSVGCENKKIICFGQETGTTFTTEERAVEAWNMRAGRLHGKEGSDRRRRKNDKFTISLGAKMQDLLWLLHKNRRPLSKQRIIAAIYGEADIDDTPYYMLVQRLRAKMKKHDINIIRDKSGLFIQPEDRRKLTELVNPERDEGIE